MNKEEVKLFLFFFLIYALFIHWTGWTEDTKFALTRAIVDEGRIEINSYRNFTGDRLYYGGNYYSGSTPGASLTAIPSYAMWKAIYSSMDSHTDTEAEYIPITIDQKNIYEIPEKGFYALVSMKEPIFEPIDRGLFVSVSMVIVTLFTSVLFSALTVILVYKISKYFTKKRNYRILVALIYGLATLAFPYALIFSEHAIATFFAFLSFYLMYKSKRERKFNEKIIFLSGLSMGFAVITSSVIAILAFFVFVYCTIEFKKKSIFYVFGGFLTYSVFLLYTYLIFSNPLTPYFLYIDQTILFTNLPKEPTPGFYTAFLESIVSNLKFVPYMMFHPSIGLFFYYPVLMISIFGLYFMFKKYRAESMIIALLFISYTTILTFTIFGLSHPLGFGMKFFLHLTPFMMIPIIFAIDKYRENRLFLFFLGILLFISIFHNIIALQEFTVIKLDSNPLYDYYLPKFLDHGPRSRLLESFAEGKIDIRDRYWELYRIE